MNPLLWWHVYRHLSEDYDHHPLYKYANGTQLETYKTPMEPGILTLALTMRTLNTESRADRLDLIAVTPAGAQRLLHLMAVGVLHQRTYLADIGHILMIYVQVAIWGVLLFSLQRYPTPNQLLFTAVLLIIAIRADYGYDIVLGLRLGLLSVFGSPSAFDVQVQTIATYIAVRLVTIIGAFALGPLLTDVMNIYTARVMQLGAYIALNEVALWGIWRAIQRGDLR